MGRMRSNAIAIMCLTLACSVAALALTPDNSGSFQVNYAANLPSGESWIMVSNTGANGAPLGGPGFGGAQGNICVNAYAFESDEQLVSCCSCLVTPNGLIRMGVNTNLLSKPKLGPAPTSVLVKLVATLAGGNGTGTSCNYSAALAGTAGAPLAPSGLVAWRTTLHAGPEAGGLATTEAAFTPATLSGSELASLTGRCTMLMGNSGCCGICPPCKLGALGASQSK